MQKKYKYWLSNENGEKEMYETDSQAVVLVGANGSGKSKLGAWIEQKEPLGVHRIGAQRKLSFKEDISLKSYSQAEDFVQYGAVEESIKKFKRPRWNYGKGYTTTLIDDFENVLAALLALKNNENEEFVSACRKADIRYRWRY